MKTCIKLYDTSKNALTGEAPFKQYTLKGKWSKESVSSFVAKRGFTCNPSIVVSYI
jgi:hypothetical protein